MRAISLSNMVPGKGNFERWVQDNLKQIETASRVDVIGGVNASGAALSTIANATANNVPMFTGATTVALLPVSVFSQGLLNDANAAAWLASLGAQGSTGVFGASGPSHSTGLVPDPGSTAGTIHFLREDATFAVPPTFIASGGSHAPGYVPDPGSSAGTTRFLREDASWVAALADPGAWTSYTPSVSSGTGTLTTASATGRYVKLGKTVHFSTTVTITTNGTGASWINVGLPTTPNTAGHAVGREGAVSFKQLQGVIFAASATMIVVNYDDSYPGASGASLVVSGTYESQ